MLTPSRFGLFVALIIILASPVHAQSLSQALMTQDIAVPLITPVSPATTVPVLANGTQDSVIISDPQEIKSIEYDASGAGFNAPVVAFTFSDNAAGPFVTATDTLSSSFLASVTFNNTPTSGANVKLPPFKYAKATLTASSLGTLPLKRLTALRRKISSTSHKAVILQDSLLPFPGLAALPLSNNTSSAAQTKSNGDPFPNANETIGFFLTSTGGTGTKKIQMRYSNSKTGPFSAWEDQGSTGFQNEVSGTAATLSINCKPFDALYWQLIGRNEAGGSRTFTRVGAIRRSQYER